MFINRKCTCQEQLSSKIRQRGAVISIDGRIPSVNSVPRVVPGYEGQGVLWWLREVALIAIVGFLLVVICIVDRSDDS